MKNPNTFELIKSIMQKLLDAWYKEFKADCSETVLTAIRHSIKDLETLAYNIKRK